MNKLLYKKDILIDNSHREETDFLKYIDFKIKNNSYLTK